MGNRVLTTEPKLQEIKKDLQTTSNHGALVLDIIKQIKRCGVDESEKNELVEYYTREYESLMDQVERLSACGSVSCAHFQSRMIPKNRMVLP